jgi:hypothetical protein
MKLNIEINFDVFNDYIGLEYFCKFFNIILICFTLEIGKIETWWGTISFNLLNSYSLKLLYFNYKYPKIDSI